MKKIVMALGAIALCASVASADVPDPTKCTVVPGDNLGPLGGLIAAPVNPAVLGSTVNTITVRNADNNPIAGASVVVQLSGSNPACTPSTLSGTTNGSGVATITIGAGGCSDGVPASGVVKANGVTIRSYPNVKSPDFDGAGGTKSINLADLTAFSAQFNGVDPPGCHDYDNDDDCDVGDLPNFGFTFSNANNCP
jgi:hypothetical protein